MVNMKIEIKNNFSIADYRLLAALFCAILLAIIFIVKRGKNEQDIS